VYAYPFPPALAHPANLHRAVIMAWQSTALSCSGPLFHASLRVHTV
jgi:hypothetical protein